MKQNRLETTPVKQLIFTMAWPAMVSMLLQAMYNFTDTIFVARFNPKAMTALAMTFAMQEVLIAVSVGTAVGISALISTSLGRKNNAGVTDAASTGLVLLTAESIPFILIGILFSSGFMRLYTGDAQIIQFGSTYLKICMVFVTGLFISTGTQRILQAQGHTGYGMVVMLAGALVNLILDPIMIYGLFGSPSLGTAGAAIATIIGQWFSALIGIILVQRILPGKLSFQLQFPLIQKIFQIGLPSILSMLAGSIMVFFLNSMLSAYSYLAVAFYGVYTKMQSIFIMTINGMGQAILPVIGFSFGAKKIDRLNESVSVSLRAAALSSAAFTLIIMIFAGRILNLFALQDSFMAEGIKAARILSLMYIPSSFSIIIGYICSGMRDGKTMLYSTVLRQIIVLFPCVYLFSEFLGLSGIWYACVIGEIAGMVFSIYRLRNLLRRNISVKEH